MENFIEAVVAIGITIVLGLRALFDRPGRTEANAPDCTIVAGWFAFKVASKWEAWTNIIQVPATIDNIPQVAWVALRAPGPGNAGRWA